MRNRPAPRAARRLVAALAVLGAALVTVVAPGATAPASAAEPTLTFVGHGYGHGRGMGQYGAYGYAVDHGWSYTQILDHYYGGTRLAGDAGNPGIGVRISRVDGRDTIVTGPALAVNGQATGTGAVLLRRDGGSFSLFTGPGCAGPWSLRSTGLPAGSAVTTSADPGVQSNLLRLCEVGKTTGYRGALTATFSGSTPVTVNQTTIDDYLLSVVPAESPAGWGAAGGGRGMHALRAQAVAARSYALSSAGVVCDTITCQVYPGSFTWPDGGHLASHEQATTTQAVRETSGQVRRGSNNAIVRAEFSSSTGGWTAGGAFPAVQDVGDGTAANPNSTWTVTMSQAEVARRLGTSAIGSIAVMARNGLGAEGGRVQTLVVRGTDGRQWSFTGNQVRTALGLKSDWFSLSGVTQAQATALVNWLYQDILGRGPDPVGLQTWTQAVMATGDAGPVAMGIVHSNERLYNFVQLQYRTALGREPDPVGTQTWVDHMLRGMTVPELQVQVYASEEGFDVLGRKNLGTWVDGVYRGILERPANGTEQAFWAAQATRLGRHGVVREIAVSDEAAVLRLHKYYRLMLGRDADPSGISTYRPMMKGDGDFVLPVQIGRSQEYFNRSQTR